MQALIDAQGDGADLQPDQKRHGVNQIDVLWITAGLSCDGDTIATTAATQPSLEDILLGASLMGQPRFGSLAFR